MIKKTIAPLLLLGGILCQAQVSTVEIPLEKNQKVVQNYTTKNGYSSILVFDNKSKTKNLEIYTYDYDLKLSYKKQFDTDFNDLSSVTNGSLNIPFYNMIASSKGEYFYSNVDEIFLNQDGSKIDYGFTIETKRPFELEGGEREFYVKNQFLTKEYTCWFGFSYLKSKSGKKRDGEYYFIRKANTDQSRKEFPIKVYNGEEGRMNLGLVKFDNEGFYTVSKDLNKELTQNKYHITGFDYDGKEVFNAEIPVVLKGKFFMPSRNGGGNVRVISTNASTYSSAAIKFEMGFASASNIYVDKQNEVFYIYGLYTDRKEGDFYNAKFGGFYVHKYNFSGEIIWELQREIDDKKDFNKKTTAANMVVDLYAGLNGELGFSVHNTYYGSAYAHFFVMNTNEGEITKSDKIDFKVDQKFHTGVRKGIKKENALLAGISMEDQYGENYMDIYTLYAAYVNENVKNYLISKKDEDVLSFNATITSEGIYLIEENLEDKIYKLMKFEWEQAF